MAVIMRLCKIGEFQSIAEFFTLKVFLEIFIVTGIMTILLMVVYFYVIHIKKELMEQPRYLAVIAVSVLISFLLSLFFGNVNLYIVPLTLSALLVASLVDKRAGILINVIISQAFFLIYIVLFGTGKVIEGAAALITSIVAGVLMVMLVEKSKSRLQFILTGLGVGAATAVLPMLINLLDKGATTESILISGLWAFSASVLSVGLYMVILPFMEFAFKLHSPYRIAEISSFDQPLLKKLAEVAPGTFNHSISVGNLAELCAQAIGESGPMARAASYYHDIGKIKTPEYFTENQKGHNPHDDFIPEVSVKMITNHTENGYEILKATRLPKIIVDTAREHHGTTHVNYFLYKAKNLTESAVDAERFRYQGPKPTTKISAIVMLCDTAEAASRAQGVSTPDEFRNFVHRLIWEKVQANQFTECPLTMKDLQIIEDTLVEAIPGMYHTRIQYPTKKG